MSSEAADYGGFACPAPILDPSTITMGHGSGGKLTARLVEETILPALRNPILEELEDQAVVEMGNERVAFTTDSFVVTPIFFPGGDIGELAVNGTINDLAVGGAKPLYLSLAFILEEGLAIEELRRVLASVQRAAVRAGVSVVTGDTKVVGRGSCDKIFINTAGIGLARPGVKPCSSRVRAGDVILLSGTVGDHGIAVLSTREGLDLHGDIASDTAPLHGLCEALLDACPDLHAMRDPTRGGVAASLVEIAERRNLGIDVDEVAFPVRSVVRGACEILGLDPLLIANEGKVLAFVPEHGAANALAAMKAHPLGRHASQIGHVTGEHPGRVVVRTAVGGRRVLDLPFAEPLPRIC
jgi:hydrogenase expression/formation protein HypE